MADKRQDLVHQPAELSTNILQNPNGKTILLVTDSFPNEDRRAGSHLAELLKRLCTQGNRVILIVRDGRNGVSKLKQLQALGVVVLANDSEALAWCGVTVSSGWNLQGVLPDTLDLILLWESFSSSLFVSEYYGPILRQKYPKAPIGLAAIAVPERHSSGAGVSQLIQDEIEHDLAHRTAEVLHNADFAVAFEPAISLGINERVAAASIETLSNLDHFDRLIERWLTSSSPSLETWGSLSSILQILHACPNLLEVSAKELFARRISAYLELGSLLIEKRNPVQALEQLRHGATVLQGHVIRDIAVAMTRCYVALGDEVRGKQWATESRRVAKAAAVQRIPAGETRAPALIRKADTPDITLIVPTYNRLNILQKCLAALEKQTVRPDQFEVIVIDDGSSDGTQEFVAGYRSQFPLTYLRQSNSGTGAARVNGVKHAKGEYLLLMNDDTICDPDLIEEHLRVQRTEAGRWAVLGSFEYPSEVRKRALTYYFANSNFMFPFSKMAEGCPYGYAEFITCNLSIRREAVVHAGSFDCTYKLSEDTELGLRLYERGYHVLYHPKAHAYHDHVGYAVSNLMKRARIYGADYAHMFSRHPRCLSEWGLPIKLTKLDHEALPLIQDYLEAGRDDVNRAMAAIGQYDSIDFEFLLEHNRATADFVLDLFGQAIPRLHWYYLMEAMYETLLIKLGVPKAHTSTSRAMKEASLIAASVANAQ